MGEFTFYRVKDGFRLDWNSTESLFFPNETAFDMAKYILQYVVEDKNTKYTVIEMTDAGKSALAVDRSRLPAR